VSIYATFEDLQIRYLDGTIPAELEPKLDVKLDEAEDMLASRVANGDLAAWIVAGHTTAARIKTVLCNMVLRVVRNPTGATTQAAGPFSMSLDKAVASGKLWLTREDRRLLGLLGSAESIEIVDDALPYLARGRGEVCVERSNADTCWDDW
jgi:hypothetical protein